MSYARFGVEDSSVYVFANTGGMLECCYCSLSPERCFEAGTTAAMIAHLAAHEAAGHTVPVSAISKIVADDLANFPRGTVPCPDHGRVTPEHECWRR